MLKAYDSFRQFRRQDAIRASTPRPPLPLIGAVNQYLERTGNHRGTQRALSGSTGLGSGGIPIVGRRQVNPVRPRIEGHGPGSPGGPEHLQDIRSPVLLARDCDGTVAAA